MAEKNLFTLGRKISSIGIPAKFAQIYKKAYPEIAHRVRIYKGYLHLQEADTIMPLMSYPRRHRA